MSKNTNFQSTSDDFDSEEPVHHTIVGTCTDLEKPYFRLGADPDSAKVRPEHVLKQSLKMLKKKWKNKDVEYRYMEEQFKSIRQDLTVQGIKSKLCVKVYETHARVSLECADLDHFNQCQTQLKELYEIGLKGHENEFISYKILYNLLTDMKYELGQSLANLTKKQKKNDAIQNSLQ
jgi:SAC3 family protein LENG8/THP3